MKTIENNKIETTEDTLWYVPQGFVGGTEKQQSYAANLLRKAVVHFWNEMLTRSQRTQENYDILIAAISEKKDPIWWIETGSHGSFAYHFQDVMPKLSLPKSGDPDWYKK